MEDINRRFRRLPEEGKRLSTFTPFILKLQIPLAGGDVGQSEGKVGGSRPLGICHFPPVPLLICLLFCPHLLLSKPVYGKFVVERVELSVELDSSLAFADSTLQGICPPL